LPAAGAANSASSASAQNTEKRREPAKRASRRAAFLLGTFLWQSKEKYLALQGETTRLKNDDEPGEKAVEADFIRE
jgi:hypothetical protein